MKLVIEYFPEHDQGDKFSTCFRITSLTNQPLLTATDLQREAAKLQRQAEEDAKRVKQTQSKPKPVTGLTGTVVKRYLPSREALRSMGYESLDAYLRRNNKPVKKRQPSAETEARQRAVAELDLDLSCLKDL